MPVALFIGLGPALDVSEEDLRKTFSPICEVVAIRMRGACAFMDVPNDQDANECIAKLNGTYINKSRLNVQLSREKRDRRDEPRAMGRGGRDEGRRDEPRREDNRDRGRRHAAPPGSL